MALLPPIEAYSTSPTPNVIVIETDGRGNEILTGLDQLANVCDAGTRVIVIGRLNDVLLYRELIRRGVSDYLIAPVGTIDVVRSICGLFSSPDAKPVGRVVAIIGAKGGVGASTIAHNLAWAVARDLKLDTVVTDLDLAFGTAGLDYNQDPPQGIADAVFSPDRIDSGFIERLMSKCADHLSLLAAPATLDRPTTSGRILRLHRGQLCAPACPASCWTCRIYGPPGRNTLLIGADDILIVAGPDLANLRNAKNILDLLKASRPNDRRPTTASTRSVFRSAPRSPPPISRRRSISIRSPLFRSIRKCSERPPTTAR